ncbi:unnamed protein product [Echinostoma caproni]|uniref:Uncharacterized protein n=1 Tax=Echinostoma caproni TaxID=27848 RepID=A0A3P8HPY3_9TREM|nr:unnamed protein product [Echinostoma caproni]
MEFGIFKPEAPDCLERRKLLEKAILYFDSIIAQTVLEIEKERATEESEALADLEFKVHDEDEINEVRHRIYEDYVDRLNKIIEPKIYLYLGHFQLLLHQFDDALSAYLKYESLGQSEAEKNCIFLYGLGLCTFRFNAFHRAERLFQRILYLQPWFPRAKEIHIRLGYIYKLQRQFEHSLKHFRQALNDSTPATFTRIEIRFHIAHLFEVCGKPKQAKAEYRQLLDSEKNNAPPHIRHLCLRQLAWLHHTGAGGVKGDPSVEKGLDVKWLQSALELDNTNGKTWYLLGRCQAALNRVQEAFAAYRSSIDKTEASADTWCSIGVLYQEQSQPMDALQAYFCAVQLDKCHVAAWANLGTLYETMQQYKEALKCYKNAVNADKNGEVRPELRSRLAILQQIVPRLPEKYITGGSHAGNSPGGGSGVTNANASSVPGAQGVPITQLPTVDEAWSLPIPAELTQRQMQLRLQEAAANGDDTVGQGGGLRGEKHLASLLLSPTPVTLAKKRFNRRHSITSNESQKSTTEGSSSEPSSKRARQDEEGMLGAVPLTEQQSQTLQTLLTQETSLTASQRQLLNHLQNQALRYHQFRVTQRHHKGGSSDPLDESRGTTCADSSTLSQKPTDDDPVGQNNPSSLTGPDAVDLFPPEDDDDLPAVVGSPGTDHLPEEALAFLTDDLLAQLNRTEAAANLDLVELALFANSGAATGGGGNGPGSGTGGATGVGSSNVNDPNTPVDDSRPLNSMHSTDEKSPNTPRRHKPEEGITQQSAGVLIKSGLNELVGDSQPSCSVDESLGDLGRVVCDTGQSVNPTGPVDLYTYLTKPLLPPTSITASLSINMSSSEVSVSFLVFFECF